MDFYNGIKCKGEKKAIWVIDDDPDDLELVEEIARTLPLPHELVLLQDGAVALGRLAGETDPPLLIICDVSCTAFVGRGTCACAFTYIFCSLNGNTR
jgi:hypothetical protein